MDSFSDYPWGHSRRYNDYPTYIKNKFGGRVQKISLNVGFTCPNRDGTKGVGGCIYCNNTTFKPGYCESHVSVREQIKTGVSFFENKYPDMKFMAYFQSYTNTYAPIQELRNLYQEAIEHPKVVGLIIGTRPDCINEEIIQLLADIKKNTPVTIEFGLESTLDKTLTEINRCHTWEESVKAIALCHHYGIDTGGHLILGLPGESYEDILGHATTISALPITTIKLHQLQVIKKTKLAHKFELNPDYIHLFSMDAYLSLVVDFLERLHPKIIVERFVSVSPQEHLIAPKWNMTKNFEIVAKVEKLMELRDTFQGRLYL